MDKKDVQIETLMREIESLKTSLSWKVTAPLRQAFKYLYGDRKINTSTDSKQPVEQPVTQFSSFFDDTVEWFKREKQTLKDYDSVITLPEEHKGIIIYPAAIKLEPYQRPQYILQALAALGYVCIFCYTDSGEESFKCEEVSENFWIINNQSFLLPQLSSEDVIFYITWCGQLPFTESFDNKRVWYDHVDLASFFSFGTDPAYTQKLCETVEKAALLTATSSILKADLQQLVPFRQDIKTVTNAVSQHWIRNDGPQKATGENGLKLVYVGAIEEWFDFDFVAKLLDSDKVDSLDVYGNVNVPLPDSLKLASSLCFKGYIPSKAVPKMLQNYDAGIIPFKVNELTNRVNPLKLYEYAAAGLFTISPLIESVKEQNFNQVLILDEDANFDEALKNFEHNPAEAIQFAQQNTWQQRAEFELDLLQEITFPEQIKKSIGPFSEETIACLTVTFMDFEGGNFYNGGAERYLLDLHEIFEQRNENFVIFQLGKCYWDIEFKNVRVIGLPVDSFDGIHVTQSTLFQLNQAFYDITNGKVKGSIYSAYFNCFPNTVSPSIGISHGVCWDGPQNQFDNFNSFSQRYSNLIYSAKSLDKMVSVDSNTSNFMMAVDHYFSKKISVIPNYVDIDKFKKPDVKSENGRIRIIYPRRLYEARGLYVLLPIVEELLKSYPHIEFHFIGKGFEEDVRHIDKLVDKFKGRVERYHLDVNDMHKSYQSADISLIPTLYSEGTSLSCLEALSSENIVVSSRVGGLTDLIIDSYNGFMIEPTEEALKAALIHILDNYEEMDELRKNARDTAKAFSKTKWQKRWNGVINEVFDDKR